MKPPRTPEEQLRRVLSTAKLDGVCLVIVAGLAALISLGIGDLVGLFVCVVVVIGGYVELSGRKQLLRGEADGMRRLVRSQLIVLNVILIYCARAILSFDVETTMGTLTPYSGMLNDLLGLDMASLLPLIRAKLPMGVYSLYGTVALLTLLYQGGLALYYRRRTEVVKQALAARLRPAVPRPVSNAAPEDLLT